jgi:hypothetical protein
MRIEIMKIDESEPLIRGFWKGLAFDLKNTVQVGKTKGTNHRANGKRGQATCWEVCPLF